MSESKKSELNNEMESMNLEELDVEELEHRLELAAAGIADPGAEDRTFCYLYFTSDTPKAP